MKPSKKTSAALERRIKAYVPQMPSGQKCHKPGSQNRKKTGYSVTGGKR